MEEICKHCGGGRFLEIRVEMDEKMYVDCICEGNTIDKIARKAYLQGYKRALDDYEIKIDEE